MLLHFRLVVQPSLVAGGRRAVAAMLDLGRKDQDVAFGSLADI
jgi:hypothetical protein